MEIVDMTLLAIMVKGLSVKNVGDIVNIVIPLAPDTLKLETNVVAKKSVEVTYLFCNSDCVEKWSN